MADAAETAATGTAAIDPRQAPDSPCWVLDLGALEHNLRLLADVQARAGCKILLALKGFATFSTFDLIGRYLSGASASSVHEAQLAHEKLNGELHVYAPAYSQADLDAVLPWADHIVFNSCAQLSRYGAAVRGRASMGLRVNPEHREVEIPLYDPCAPQSRLGVTAGELTRGAMEQIDGLHFHTLCELGADALQRTLEVVQSRFAEALQRVRWVNFGGGHHITRPGYDRALLVELVREFSRRHDVEVYLEPGEAIAIRTGVLVATVLDLVCNDAQIAILDTSATAHMPDVLEMPYRPEVRGAARPGRKAHTYRLAGLTCLAGDVIGDYSFEHPLAIGDRLVFEDMAHYTLVKTTNFNGVRLPSIALRHGDGRVELVKRFDYDSYRDRLS